MARRGKYGARQVRVAGHLFRSQWERDRYQQLELLQAAGEISELSYDPPKFTLHDAYTCRRTGKRVKASTYEPDFFYLDKRGAPVYEDAKGTKRRESVLKRKIVEARHGVVIWFSYRDGRME